ncbi:MAG TPA: hypothetical protein VJR92_03090 [Gemmatimonadaceae bacterium]|nr:hypothetical protein [Gemmatimonadaceae bacterium]
MNRDINHWDRGDVQDRLPDLVHGRLSDDERAAVERAVAADPELARELRAVHEAQRALTGRAAAVDVSRIAAAVRRPARSGLGVARWRIAAAIATIAVGGASLAVVQQTRFDTPADSLAVIGAPANEPHAVSLGFDLSSLSAEQLEQLLAELERTGGLPSVEPRTTVVIPPVEERQ